MINVEVVYGTAEKQSLKKIKLKQGATALDAVIQSEIKKDFNEIDLDNLSLGIFSKKIKPETPLKAGDRVEIYRPLLIDPMTKRRIRASK